MTGDNLLSWLNDNSGAVNVGLNAAMVLIWLVYLQLFLLGYLRQRRPTILINRGAGTGPHARCLIGNMSADPIYVQSLIARLRTEEGTRIEAVTDIGRAGDGDGDGEDEPLGSLTKQGPLESGAYMNIGSFTDVMRRLDPKIDLGRLDGPRGRPAELEIIVAAIHGSDDLLIGARRTYRIERREDGLVLTPPRLQATQIRSRWGRMRLRRRYMAFLQA